MNNRDDDGKIFPLSPNNSSTAITVDREIKTDGEFGNIRLPEGKYVVGSFEIGPEGFTNARNQLCLQMSESGYQPSDGQPYELLSQQTRRTP